MYSCLKLYYLGIYCQMTVSSCQAQPFLFAFFPPASPHFFFFFFQTKTPYLARSWEVYRPRETLPLPSAAFGSQQWRQKVCVWVCRWAAGTENLLYFLWRLTAEESFTWCWQQKQSLLNIKYSCFPEDQMLGFFLNFRIFYCMKSLWL